MSLDNIIVKLNRVIVEIEKNRELINNNSIEDQRKLKESKDLLLKAKRLLDKTIPLIENNND